eukprot:jgi/Hompol1/1543/HPOL_005626-RA
MASSHEWADHESKSQYAPILASQAASKSIEALRFEAQPKASQTPSIVLVQNGSADVEITQMPRLSHAAVDGYRPHAAPPRKSQSFSGLSVSERDGSGQSLGT